MQKCSYWTSLSSSEHWLNDDISVSRNLAAHTARGLLPVPGCGSGRNTALGEQIRGKTKRLLLGTTTSEMPENAPNIGERLSRRECETKTRPIYALLPGPRNC